MDPEDIEEMFGTDIICQKCILNGFKRHYGQRSEWRTDQSGERAGVLTVSPHCRVNKSNHKQESCNGILISRIDDDRYDQYKKRETGYQIVEIDKSLITPFEDDASLDTENQVSIPIGGCPMAEWNPVESYMKNCESASEYWGSDFKDMFCETTYKTLFSQEKPHK